MQILSEKGRLDSFLYGSFSMKIFDQIAKLPESQNFIKQTMGKIFKKLDLDYLESIDLEKATINWKIFQDEKDNENELNLEQFIEVPSSMTCSRKDNHTSNPDSDFSIPTPPEIRNSRLEVIEPKLIYHHSEQINIGIDQNMEINSEANMRKTSLGNLSGRN